MFSIERQFPKLDVAAGTLEDVILVKSANLLAECANLNKPGFCSRDSGGIWLQARALNSKILKREAPVAFDVDRINQSIRRIAKFIKKNSKRPSSEAIHNLRTSTRTVETTLSTLGLDKRKNAKRLLRNLENLRKRAGKVRDMDVLTEDALELKRKPQEEQDCVVQLLECLGAKRDKYARKLRREIESRCPELRRDLRRNSKQLENVLEQAKNKPGASGAMPATLAKMLELTSELKSPVRLNRKNLHPYRLKVKELRNVLQMSDKTAEAEFLEKLGEVKDAIGAWHDWEELVGIATRSLDHGPSCKLIKRMKTTSEAKYRQALSSTNRMRRTYLNGHSRQRAQKPNGSISEPVLEAASKITA